MFSYDGYLKYAYGGVCFISGLYHKKNEICSVQMHKNTFESLFENTFLYYKYKCFSTLQILSYIKI